MIAEWYTIDGNQVDVDKITLNTKSIFKAMIMLEQGYGVKYISSSYQLDWVLMGIDNKRLLVSINHG